MESPLIKQLNALSSVEDETQLEQLQSIIEAIESGPCSVETSSALLGLFERFPESDAYGIFWSIVHLLEANEGYEPLLVSSVIRRPSEFSVLMINRLINGGVAEVGGTSLVGLLEAVESNPKALPSVQNSASKFLALQRSGGVNA